MLINGPKKMQLLFATTLDIRKYQERIKKSCYGILYIIRMCVLVVVLIIIS